MVGGRRKKHFCRKRMSRASLMSSYMKLDCASKILKRVISGKKRKRRRAREEEGRIWRDGGGGESANIPGGEWTLEMPGWPQPTLCSQGVGDQIEGGQTRPPDGEEHTWEPKTKPNRLSQAPTGSCPFNFSYSTQPSVWHRGNSEMMAASSSECSIPWKENSDENLSPRAPALFPGYCTILWLICVRYVGSILSSGDTLVKYQATWLFRTLPL